MRATVIIALGVLMIFSLGRTTNAAEIYWDINEVPDAKITEKDFQFQYGTGVSEDSLYKRGIYDSGRPPSLDSPDTPEAKEPRIAPRSPSRSSTRPARASERSSQSVTPKRTSPQSAEATDKKPAAGKESVKRSESKPDKGPSKLQNEEPKVKGPADAKPVTEERDAKGTEPTLGDKEKAPLPAPEAASDKPEVEKLKWGKSEPQPEGDESKVRWGR